MTNLVQIRYLVSPCKYLYLVFDQPSKLRVVHMRKKCKIFIFSKMGLLYIRTPRIWHYRLFLKKVLTRKIFFNFLSAPNVVPKPADQSCSNSIFRVLLQLSPASPFDFQPSLNIKDTLMLRVVHIRNKKRNDKHGILQRSIVFVAMSLNQQGRPPRKYYQSSKISCL